MRLFVLRKLKYAAYNPPVTCGDSPLCTSGPVRIHQCALQKAALLIQESRLFSHLISMGASGSSFSPQLLQYSGKTQFLPRLYPQLGHFQRFMHQIPATIRKANPSSIIPTPINFTVSGLNNTTTHQKNTHAANTIEQRRVTLNTVLSVHAFFCFFIDSHSSFREELLSRTYFFSIKSGERVFQLSILLLSSARLSGSSFMAISSPSTGSADSGTE